MFNTFIVEPIFNVLITIYGLLPGHDFGISILLFSLITRLIMWPLIKKQLHHSKKIKALQPELVKIKKKAGDNKQLAAQMQMELYREKEINPFAPIGLLIVQIPLLLGLFSVIRQITNDPSTIVSKAYEPVRNIPFIQDVAADPSIVDQSLLGAVDLSRRALEGGGWYLPLLVIALMAGVIQYFTSKMLLPQSKSKKKLREIMKEGADGKEPDREEIQAAVGRSTSILLPGLMIFFGITFPGALALYWTANSAIGYIQQRYVLGQDLEEMKKVTVTTRTVTANKKPVPKKKAAAKNKTNNKKTTAKKGGKKKGKK